MRRGLTQSSKTARGLCSDVEAIAGALGTQS